MTLGSSIGEGRYLVLDLLGKGGMSTVFRVHDTRLGVDRALKVLSPRLASSSSLRARFGTEAKTMARLQHPNVVSVQDIGEESGLLYIVMELLEGGTLTQWVALNGPMPARLAVDTLMPVLDALECAHEAGIFHRDVKPENIFLTRRGGAKIGDFGIAYVADLAIAESGAPSMAGTWAYMPPEQRNGAQAKGDARSDVYALASVLFFLLTARTPVDLFAAGDVPSLLEPLQGPLAEVILRATRYDPGLRFESVRGLREALSALLPSLPSVPESTPPLVRPNPLNGKTAPGVPVRAEFLTPAPDMFASPTLIAFDSMEDDGGAARKLVAMLAAKGPPAMSAGPTAPPAGATLPPPGATLPPSHTAPPLAVEPASPAAPAVHTALPSQPPTAPPAEPASPRLSPVLYVLGGVLLVLLAWYAGLRWSAAREQAVEPTSVAAPVVAPEAAPPEPAPATTTVPVVEPEAAPPEPAEPAPSAAKASSPSRAPTRSNASRPSAASAPTSAPAEAPAASPAPAAAPAAAPSPKVRTSDLKNPFGG